MPDIAPRWDELPGAVSLWLRDRRVVADIGAGPGIHAMALAGDGHVVVAIDVNEPRMTTLRKDSGSILALVADAKRLPLLDSRVDAVLCFETLEHVGDWRTAVDEMARVTRPGGMLVLSVPTVSSELLFRRLHRKWAEMSGHLEIIDERELERHLATEGWVVTSKLRLHGVFTLLWLLLAPLQTPFDDTGTPLRYAHIQRLYWGAWRLLSLLRLRRSIEGLADRQLPKSVLLICRRA